VGAESNVFRGQVDRKGGFCPATGNLLTRSLLLREGESPSL